MTKKPAGPSASELPLPLGDDVGEADIRAAQRWGEGPYLTRTIPSRTSSPPRPAPAETSAIFRAFES
jgi:hypothetical protein